MSTRNSSVFGTGFMLAMLLAAFATFAQETTDQGLIDDQTMDDDLMPAVDTSAMAEQEQAREEQDITRTVADNRVMDTIEPGRTEITGNQELPKVLYIVPWQKSDPGDLMGKPVNTLLDEVLAPIDREEFIRQVGYYDDLNGTAFDEVQNGDYYKTKLRVRWYAGGTGDATTVTPFLECKRKLGARRVKTCEVPVIFDTNSEDDIEAAVEFAEEMELDYIIRGGRQAWKIIDFLVEHDVKLLFSGIHGAMLNLFHRLLSGHFYRNIQEIAYDRLNITANITHFGKLGRFNFDKWRFRQACQTPGNFSLTHPGRTNHKYVFRGNLTA